MTKELLTLEKVPQAVSQIQDQLDRLLLAVLSTEHQSTLLPGKPITTKELCKFLNISTTTCIRWRKKGRIPFLRIGGSVRYDRNAVITALESKNGGRS